MAFVIVVAAFGEKLRRDKYPGAYGFADIQRSAGNPQTPRRREFVRLAGMAGDRQPGGG